VQDFRKLAVWEKAHQFTLSTYQATRVFPKEEIYGLTNQIRRSAASIPAHIAEGCGRNSTGSSGVSWKLQWVRPAKQNIICCWHTISII
jgi:hypothetical protein